MLRRRIYITGRPEPRAQAPAPRYTMEHRLTIWTKQLAFVALVATLALGAWWLWPGDNVSGSVSPDLRAGFITMIPAVAECAVSMEYAHPEDELCTTWLVGEDQHVVFGPLWARP